MYKRHTKAERSTRKTGLFEFYHPKNKHVMRHQAKRGARKALENRLFSECVLKLAVDGNGTARAMLRIMKTANGYWR